jgi:hypothetical protein
MRNHGISGFPYMKTRIEGRYENKDRRKHTSP